MLNYSVLEENTERVSKKCIWLLTVGLIASVSAVALILGYFVLVSGKKPDVENRFDTCKYNRTKWEEKYSNVSLIYNQKLTILKDWSIKLALAKERNARLGKIAKDVQAELDSAKGSLLMAEIVFGACAAVGTASIAANAYYVPYLLSAPSQLDAIRNESNYISPRYLNTIKSSVNHFVFPKESATDSYKLNLLYNSTATGFDKAKFTASVDTKANTVTLIKTKAGESMGFMLKQPWSFSGNIIDPDSFTFSFRKFFKTTKHAADTPAVVAGGFLYLGDNKEIAIETSGTGKAAVGNGYDPPEVQQDPNDFYVVGGNFNVDTILVYEVIFQSR